jgi:DNA polymerase I-like protein with 3'-5' exonuclease and polymerase domains|nr:MAG TPA: DNA POLYMERASE [Caudoviricetes sp.]
MTLDSLWGDDFVIKETPKQAKKVIEKIKQPKTDVKSVKRAVSSKKLSIEDKLKLITEEVNRILGRYESNTQVITTYADLVSYIDKSIENKVIAIDTETNNSLDPITCKIMGGCIYTPGCKNAYIPINHTTLTGERLDWQITEKQLAEQFSRLIEAKTDIIMHNGKFDYEVIKCTCGVELPITWDTMIGAKVLDENERSAGLKQQYIDKIDPSIEKYSIDHLFSDIEYAVVDPNVFALYAATDSYMTYKLYEWQLAKFNDPDLSRLFDMFKRIEMPLVPVVAEMELAGVDFDIEYDERLSKKYHKKLDELDSKIADELEKLKPQIDTWRLSSDANYKPVKKNGAGEGKSKNEQLSDPINVASPTQLAILLYDILGIKAVDKKNPRGTGEDILERIQHPLAKLLLERRGLMKLITAFIDSLPTWVNPKTGRIHCHFNAYGAATGRFSSSEPNLQQIPSHNHELRLLFRAGTDYMNISYEDDYFECNSASAIMSNNKYVRVKDLSVGDVIDVDCETGDKSKDIITKIEFNDTVCRIWTKGGDSNEKVG